VEKLPIPTIFSARSMLKTLVTTRKHWPIAALLALVTLPIGDSIAQARRREVTIDQIPRTGRNMQLPEMNYNPGMVVDANGANAVQVISIISRDGKLGAAIKLRKQSPKDKEPIAQVLFPGDSLQNGQIILKRIEKRNSAMIAVLEEDGAEVIRYVGDL
jgi:hypothetical protein